MTGSLRKLRGAAVTGVICLWLCQAAAWGEEPWRKDFEETCSRTAEAMELSVPELNLLLDRCSALQKVVETQDDSVRKVYLKRLQLCRNLYAYVIEYKKNQQAPK